MKTIVISLGGSLITPDSIDTDFLTNFRKLILESPNRFVIICGGGKTCRTYQNAANEITEISAIDSDLVGIASTQLNAELVRAIFSEQAYEKVLGDPEIYIETDKKILIGAGWLPGHSSDMGAVLLAKTYGAHTVINMSNIDMVYDKDPNKFDDAKPIKDISWDDYMLLIGEEWTPGRSTPFDPVSAKKAKELGVCVIIANGNLDNLINIIKEKEFKGTTIS